MPNDNVETQEEIMEPLISLEQLVNLGIEKSASDIHFRVGGRPALRIGGRIVFVDNTEPLSENDVQAMTEVMLTDADKEELQERGEVDLTYTHKNGVNFRVNIFYQRGVIACVMRMISKNIPTLDNIGLPDDITRFLQYREGLILICGTTGSGRSTTIQSMLNYINDNDVKHVLTIENPIEYMFDDNKSMFTHREIGKDVPDLITALQSASREDANVVMVSEVNSFEEFDLVLNLVENGHLVITSLSTKNAPQTIEHMVSMYPPDLREHAKHRISTDVKLLLAQDLLPRQDQAGQIAVFEIMYMNDSIRNVIRLGNFSQLKAAIQGSLRDGMITMESYAERLAERGIVSQEDANKYKE